LSTRAESRQAKVEPDARARLREAALECIGRGGIKGASTREIVARAGLRNPSAITYHFGSKAALFDDLAREVYEERAAIILKQVALADGPEPPSPLQWVETAVDAASGMVNSVRGCMLSRLIDERHDVDPDFVENFLSGPHDVARSWRAAVASTFPEIPLRVAIARNIIVLRTLQWIIARRARRYLEVGEISPTETAATRPFLIEVALNVLTPATALNPESLGGS
jgi:AcrR family transcriptional regulator